MDCPGGREGKEQLVAKRVGGDHELHRGDSVVLRGEPEFRDSKLFALRGVPEYLDVDRLSSGPGVNGFHPLRPKSAACDPNVDFPVPLHKQLVWGIVGNLRPGLHVCCPREADFLRARLIRGSGVIGPSESLSEVDNVFFSDRPGGRLRPRAQVQDAGEDSQIVIVAVVKKDHDGYLRRDRARTVLVVEGPIGIELRDLLVVRRHSSDHRGFVVDREGRSYPVGRDELLDRRERDASREDRREKSDEGYEGDVFGAHNAPPFFLFKLRIWAHYIK
ncbi:MAG: hypothetical protein LiPW15_594 [Parcubacteria group bacterium LiPW_15]|nr:MAG: hypothetical protein LiPW15_594 [Parcubacteria group bacterium LiPW_15]